MRLAPGAPPTDIPADQLRWAEFGRNAMPGEDVTPGELGRRLDRIERKIDNLQFVRRDVYDVEMSSVKARLDDLEEGRRWAFRGIVTSLVFPVLVAVILALVLTR